MFLYHLPTPPLPIAPRPFPEELLLSWICRIAAANHVNLNLFFPEMKAVNRYRLNSYPGEQIITRLAAMARLPQSTLRSLLLPNQFPNLPLLSFLQVPESPPIFSNEDPSESFPLPFCSECAGEEERPQRSLYWQAEIGLLTTILCPKHGTFFGRDCPGCNRGQLTLAWDQARLNVRCLRCSWRPVASLNRKPVSSCPSGLRQLLFRLQHDLTAALRGQPPSSFWCGEISAVQFLRVVEDLYWLLRTPGLSARCGQKFTFTDGFSWARLRSNSRTLFARISYWPFAAWDRSSRAEVLLAIAATMLGIRAFETLGSNPGYPVPSVSYPWDWILPCLKKPYAQELLNRAENWPTKLRLPVSIAAGTIKAGGNRFP